VSEVDTRAVVDLLAALAYAELIIAGTGDLAGNGRLIERITAAHTDRMKRLGLTP
jgi:hypothetical protein